MRARNKVWVATVGCLFFIFWFLGGILPYLLHRPDWDNHSFGDPISWIQPTLPIYDFYYLFGVVGGWQWMVVSSVLCFYFSIARRITNRVLFFGATLILAYALIILIAVSNQCTGAVIRVLE